MIKTQASLEVEKNDRIYRFTCENDSPLGETYDALREMLQFVIDKIKEVEKPKEGEDASKQ